MRYPILNTYVDIQSFDETIELLGAVIKKRTPVQHVVLNASKINLMQEDEELKEIVNSCSIINADGASIVWAAKQLGVPVKERVAGIDLFNELVRLAPEKGWRIYLFGAKDEVVKRVREIFLEKYPGIVIAGIRGGYFSEEESGEIVSQIAASNSDILFVAFSSPKKEYWIHTHLNDLNVPLAMGVGGSFDVIAGMTRRAPLWMQKRGLEWFYRFIQEPRRMWKRYIVGNFKFVRLVWRERSE